MDLSNFKGCWVGLGRGAQFGRVKVRISEVGGALNAYGIGRTPDGEVEIFFFEGKPESETKVVLDLIDYVTDNPNTNPPTNAHIIVDYIVEKDNINIKFATDVGTHGGFRLRRASLFQSAIFGIPPLLQTSYRHLKYYLRSRLRHLYLIVVLGLTFLSVYEKMPVKIAMVEGILLIFPLIFLYGAEVRGLISALALRKAGPFEFESQASTASHVTPDQVVDILKNEFGENSQIFSATSKFLVSKTKAVLRLMAAENESITKQRFYKMAAGLGVLSNDIEPTLNALLQTDCISVSEDNKYLIQDFGNQFLWFETRVEQLYQ